jgi:hypothetical protein
MNPIVEVVTSQPVAPGVTAHLRGGVLYGHVMYPGMTIAKEAAYPRCNPISRPEQAVPMYSYSAGWAQDRGAQPCPDDRCFGRGA